MSNFVNLLDGTGIYYKYDDNNRLTSYVEYDTDDMTNTFSSTIFYDEKSRPNGVYYSMDYYSGTSVLQSSIEYFHAYDDMDGTLEEYSVTTNTTSGSIAYNYDGFKRVNQKTYNFCLANSSTGEYTNTLSYTFVNSQWHPDRTSSLVHTVTSKVNNYAAVTYTYEYDYNGNVTKITLSNGTEYRYVYDELGQLIREDNTVANKTYVYTYDNAGNILTKHIYALTAAGVTPTSAQSTYNYGYNDTSWGDKLTSYRGVSFTYDEIGNPLTYYNGSNYTFTWENGRQLSTLTRGSYYSLSFEYNDEGIRTSKISNGVEHIYHLNGSLIMSEEWSNNLVLYIYDTDGSPIGMQYRNTSYAEGVFDTYWYEKNLQGDIVAVYDEDGTKLVTYTYDAWGNCTVSYPNNGSSSTAIYNPFRYRGYYLDTETGFYYLNSRYYDPAIGRFLNADSVVSGTGESVHGYNLFAYCFNNPVNMSDTSGNWPKWATKLVAAVAVVAAVATVAAVTVATAGTGTAIAAVAVGAAKGAAIGFAVGATSGAAIGYATTGTLEGTLDGMADGALNGSISGAITGGANGYLNHSSAAKFLKSNGANPQEVLSTYKGTPKVKTLKADTTVYRTWGGTTQELGHWVSPNNYGSSARNLLSLPTSNTMTNTSSFLIRKGTTVLVGKAAPLFGQHGGGVQWWISVLG